MREIKCFSLSSIQNEALRKKLEADVKKYRRGLLGGILIFGLSAVPIIIFYIFYLFIFFGISLILHVSLEPLRAQLGALLGEFLGYGLSYLLEFALNAFLISAPFLLYWRFTKSALKTYIRDYFAKNPCIAEKAYILDNYSEFYSVSRKSEEDGKTVKLADSFLKKYSPGAGGVEQMAQTEYQYGVVYSRMARRDLPLGTGILSGMRNSVGKADDGILKVYAFTMYAITVGISPDRIDSIIITDDAGAAEIEKKLTIGPLADKYVFYEYWRKD